MPWSFWMITAVMLVIVEILTPGMFFFACLGIGALAAALVSFIGMSTGVQWLVFAVVALASIYFIRPVARKLFIQHQRRTNIDELIGQKAWVVEPITPPHPGMVKIEGELWRAEAEEAVSPGVYVEVMAIRGTRLIVKKTA